MLRMLCIYHLFFIGNLFAKDCGAFRLDKSGSVRHLPVMNQGRTNICYSIVAAALIDSWRFSHGDSNFGFLTSPLGLAMNAKGESRGSLDYGFVKRTVNRGIILGICSMKQLPLSYEDIDLGFLLDILENKLFTRKKVRCEKEGISESKSQEIIKMAENSEFYIELFSQICKKKKFDIPLAQSYPFLKSPPDKRGKMFERMILNNFGEKHPQPIAVTYCSKVKVFKSAEGIDKQGNVNRQSCGVHHASLLVGKRLNPFTERCEFLIRDSFGENCGENSWGCEEGQFWIDAHSLGRNVLELNKIGKFTF